MSYEELIYFTLKPAFSRRLVTTVNLPVPVPPNKNNIGFLIFDYVLLSRGSLGSIFSPKTNE